MASQDVAISRRHIIGEVPMMVCEISDRCLYTGFSVRLILGVWRRSPIRLQSVASLTTRN